MKKVLMLLLFLIIITATPVCAQNPLGFSVSIFISNMESAAKSIGMWSASSINIPQTLQTKNGSYVADFGHGINLYINTVTGTKMVKNVALSLTDDIINISEKHKVDKSEILNRFRIICMQMILASDPITTEETADNILSELGMGAYMKIYDGRQRNFTTEKRIYMMKLHNNGIIMFALSGK